MTVATQTRAPHIALYTEGTYPQAHGGVSVWVDQLVRGLDDHQFAVQAISGLPFTRAAVPMPENVSFTQVPLWGAPPPAPARPDAARRREVEEAYLAVLDGLCTLDLDLFGAGLQMLSGLGQRGGFTALLDTPRLARLTLDTWAGHATRQALGRQRDDARLPLPTVADALDAQTWLEHALRPLGHPAPQAQVGHAVSNGFAGLLALHGLWSHNTPFVLTEHGVYLRERYMEFRRSAYSSGFKGLLLRFYRLLCSLVYREATLVLPGSHYNRRWEERLGAHPDKIHCVYNGIDPEIFPPAEQEPVESVVSWVGRIDPLKDIETLIRAFDLVRRRNAGAQLRLFGGTPAGNEDYLFRCQSLTQQLNLTEHVTFEGRIDDITDAYRAGQVVALTSVSEGFPYTVIEAMAMGRPPVATRVGGVPEAVGDAGLIVRPRDVMGVASALTRLLDDAPLRARLGRAARERVMELFTLDGCLDAYRRAYPLVIAGEAWQ
ncbi:GT4 family glycosyltransferase PelF [Deinococcus humi]|uniref:Glycosyltransferase involved in cell wall biosynthesis n=1 Tax=Deinococcus humi TaxID=662880 RepID=A0A7W8NEZ6_9DEIO|nr:GT4 family glycosyltransferase PelF [Deinococcus humi]MBB5361487.1 glycosyltransferase involved in cell wall biosynthesis [Deinococcus humi]GGO20323.1 lipopolysaccharide glycosyltransferase, putative [Deinococcus humi]